MSMATDIIIIPITATESGSLVILVQAIFHSPPLPKQVLQKQCNFLVDKGPLKSGPWLFQLECAGLWTRNLFIILIERKKKKSFSTLYVRQKQCWTGSMIPNSTGAGSCCLAQQCDLSDQGWWEVSWYQAPLPSSCSIALLIENGQTVSYFHVGSKLNRD